MQEDIIKKYFDAANSIVISEMYLNCFPNGEIDLKDLKKYNPGHLGTSMGINFILANLYCFLNQNKLSSQTIIGTGHAGVSLMANLWLNGTLSKYYSNYSRDSKGLNNLINDFGKTIRGEINPLYPETIYDGGELGYSLGVAYGYALKSQVDIVPCIIGDGEAETGTIMASWQLAKLLKTKSKVLPIINLNGLKMGSNSFLSKLNIEELNNYFTSLGYNLLIVDTNNNPIIKMQDALNQSLKLDNPLIIFKSPKGYTLDSFENNPDVHKNPLVKNKETLKLQIIKNMLMKYDLNIFDDNNNLLPLFDNFKIETPKQNIINIKKQSFNLESLDDFVYNLLKENKGMIFSPDEIYSNFFYKSGSLAFELLNENVLQALYQGYIMAGGFGYYIAYEGFMPIISSMLTQYYKYLKQKSLTDFHEVNNSLNYILTSTCWENTYSHQNPDIVNSLFEKLDNYYNIVYPKDKISAIKWLDSLSTTKDKINILTISKRHDTVYEFESTNNQDIEIITNSSNPDIILCATGDYMLDIIMEVSKELENRNIFTKVIYVTKPQILNINNYDSLSEEEFTTYFNENTPIIYLYCGYASTIKSLLYDRDRDIEVLGYNDGISVFGTFLKNALSNNVSKDDIIDICNKKLESKTKVIKRG